MSCAIYRRADCFQAPAVYTQAFHKLVEASYLKPSTVLSHQSPRDKRIQYEAEEKAKIPGYPTAKDLRQAKETADARLKREEEEAEKVGMVSALSWDERKESRSDSWLVIETESKRTRWTPRTQGALHCPCIAVHVTEYIIAESHRGRCR